MRLFLERFPAQAQVDGAGALGVAVYLELLDNLNQILVTRDFQKVF